MSNLNSIINISIALLTKGVSKAGFGLGMFLSEVSRFSDRYRTYTEADDMLSDGFKDTDNAYIAAQSYFGQNNKPTKIYIGRKLGDVNSLQVVTFDDLATAGTFTVQVGAQTTAAINWDDNAAAIKAAIELLTGVTEVIATGDMPVKELKIEFTGADGNQHWDDVIIDVSALTGVTTATVKQEQYGSTAESYTDALAAIRNTQGGDDWYGIGIESRVKADILEVASVMSTLFKMFGSCTDDADVLTSAATDVASSLKAANRQNTWIIYSEDESKFPEMSYFGENLPEAPGSITWCYKGITNTVDFLTSTEQGYALGKNANINEELGGRNNVHFGKVADSNFIDTIRGAHWLRARIQERLWYLLVNAKKIPYTNKGGGLLKGEISAQLEDSSDAGFTTLDYTVTVPLVEDQSPNDRAARHFPGTKWTAVLQGAVHTVKVEGELSV